MLPTIRVHQHQRPLAGAVDPVRLLRELRHCQQGQNRIAQHEERPNGVGEHADLEPHLLGDASRDGVEDRPLMQAFLAPDGGPPFAKGPRAGE